LYVLLGHEVRIEREFLDVADHSQIRLFQADRFRISVEFLDELAISVTRPTEKLSVGDGSVMAFQEVRDVG
tara:strand:- start:7 stop:219 length:213 start_codon:yes stop_codon:yes gene_type:complete